MEKWTVIGNRMPDQLYSLDRWNGGLASLRQYLRGWSANANGNFKMEKMYYLDCISRLDAKADNKGLTAEDWIERYRAEREMEHLYDLEEKYWQQRGAVKWITQGDANTSFFFVVVLMEEEGKILFLV